MENQSEQANNKSIKKLGIILLLIVGSAFYWFAIRPSEIKKECAMVHQEWEKYIEENYCQSTKTIECLKMEAKLTRYNLRIDDREKEYEQCLREHGL